MSKKKFQVSIDSKRFEWIDEDKVLIWAFVPSENRLAGGEDEIGNRIIAEVTELITTDHLKNREEEEVPFTGEFFSIKAERGCILVTKEAVYRFEKNLRTAYKVKIEKLTPEPDSLDIWVTITNMLGWPGSRYGSQFGLSRWSPMSMEIKVGQPAELAVAELRSHLT